MTVRVGRPWGSFSYTVIVTVRVGQPWGLFGFTVGVTVRVGQPWGSFGFIGGQVGLIGEQVGLIRGQVGLRSVVAQHHGRNMQRAVIVTIRRAKVTQCLVLSIFQKLIRCTGFFNWRKVA